MKELVRFYNKLRNLIGTRIYLLMGLILIAGFVEGIGVTLFFPVLQSGFGDDKLSRILKFFFNIFHLEFSISLVLVLIAIFFILRSVFLVSYMRFFGKLSSNLLMKLRRNILNKIFATDYVYILKKEIGYMSNAIDREISRVVEVFDTFAYMFNYGVYILIYLTLCMLLNPHLSAVIILVSPALMLIIKRVNILAGQASRDLSSSYGRFQSILIQALSKFKYLKSTFSSGKVSEIVDRENRQTGLQTFRLLFFHSLTRYVFEPIFVIIVVGFLFYHVVLLGRSVNEIIFLSFLFMQVTRQFINAQSSYRRFVSSIGSIETLDNFERELDENREDLHTDGIAPDFGRDISLKDITVIFPNGRRALEEVDITIRPKSVTAFVGHSGSGKSTIANMVAGIVRPTSGRIIFGDTDYNRLNLRALRQKIGYVTQEDVIFNASIKENVTLWGERIDKDRLGRVIQMAHIGGFVQDLPEREHAMLGDNGLDISGGQRQRITIARELYKDASLLILDEATSSLDSKAEKQIYENLKEFKGKKTMIVIAHRLSTIKNADYVYVLDRGRVVEKGTYDELNRKTGEFKQMIEEQKLV